MELTYISVKNEINQMFNLPMSSLGKCLLSFTLLISLSATAQAQSNSPSETMLSTPIRLSRPHHISLALDWPSLAALNYRYNLDSNWALGPHLTPLSLGFNGRYYLSPENASSYLELRPIYHPFMLMYGKSGPSYSLNGRYGWEYRWQNGFSFDLATGVGLALVGQREVWAFLNLGMELGWSF